MFLLLSYFVDVNIVLPSSYGEFTCKLFITFSLVVKTNDLFNDLYRTLISVLYGTHL